MDLYTGSSSYRMRDSRLSMSLDSSLSSRSTTSSWGGGRGSSMDLTYRDYFGPPKLTKFDEKMIELKFLKYEIKAHMKKINALKLKYRDWFSSKQQSFLDSVKLIQILAGKMVPNEISTLEHFKKVHRMACKFPRNGTPRDGGPAKMDEFMFFWNELCSLKIETDELYEKIGKYCDSITDLRQPAVKDRVDEMYKQLNIAFAEDFDFTCINNEKDNLFTYSISTYDHKYHGLVGYVPYLMTLSLRMFHYALKLHLEKE
ncbi:hypothetical protein ACJMK2_031764 [Sinanodonta woodiana]|uniref:Uncharacterized protein n=1 Tax=Sinanodonta woodiana TaxID=1069815 RepID=A0ABD3WZR7_SINWO